MRDSDDSSPAARSRLQRAKTLFKKASLSRFRWTTGQLENASAFADSGGLIMRVRVHSAPTHPTKMAVLNIMAARLALAMLVRPRIAAVVVPARRVPDEPMAWAAPTSPRLVSTVSGVHMWHMPLIGWHPVGSLSCAAPSTLPRCC